MLKKYLSLATITLSSLVLATEGNLFAATKPEKLYIKLDNDIWTATNETVDNNIKARANLFKNILGTKESIENLKKLIAVQILNRDPKNRQDNLSDKILEAYKQEIQEDINTKSNFSNNIKYVYGLLLGMSLFKSSELSLTEATYHEFLKTAKNKRVQSDFNFNDFIYSKTKDYIKNTFSSSLTQDKINSFFGKSFDDVLQTIKYSWEKYAVQLGLFTDIIQDTIRYAAAVIPSLNKKLLNTAIISNIQLNKDYMKDDRNWGNMKLKWYETEDSSSRTLDNRHELMPGVEVNRKIGSDELDMTYSIQNLQQYFGINNLRNKIFGTPYPQFLDITSNNTKEKWIGGQPLLIDQLKQLRYLYCLCKYEDLQDTWKLIMSQMPEESPGKVLLTKNPKGAGLAYFLHRFYTFGVVLWQNAVNNGHCIPTLIPDGFIGKLASDKEKEVDSNRIKEQEDAERKRAVEEQKRSIEALFEKPSEELVEIYKSIYSLAKINKKQYKNSKLSGDSENIINSLMISSRQIKIKDKFCSLINAVNAVRNKLNDVHQKQIDNIIDSIKHDKLKTTSSFKNVSLYDAFEKICSKFVEEDLPQHSKLESQPYFLKYLDVKTVLDKLNKFFSDITTVFGQYKNVETQTVLSYIDEFLKIDLLESEQLALQPLIDLFSTSVSHQPISIIDVNSMVDILWRIQYACDVATSCFTNMPDKVKKAENYYEYNYRYPDVIKSISIKLPTVQDKLISIFKVMDIKKILRNVENEKLIETGKELLDKADVLLNEVLKLNYNYSDQCPFGYCDPGLMSEINDLAYCIGTLKLECDNHYELKGLLDGIDYNQIMKWAPAIFPISGRISFLVKNIDDNLKEKDPYTIFESLAEKCNIMESHYNTYWLSKLGYAESNEWTEAIKSFEQENRKNFYKDIIAPIKKVILKLRDTSWGTFLNTLNDCKKEIKALNKIVHPDKISNEKLKGIFQNIVRDVNALQKCELTEWVRYTKK